MEVVWRCFGKVTDSGSGEVLLGLLKRRDVTM